MTYDAEYRFEEESKFESTAIMDSLKFRKVQIEKTVDDHLTELHGRGQLELFQELTYVKKVEYMYRFALQIKNLQERLQMDGIT